eukprot:g8022.t1
MCANAVAPAVGGPLTVPATPAGGDYSAATAVPAGGGDIYQQYGDYDGGGGPYDAGGGYVDDGGGGHMDGGVGYGYGEYAAGGDPATVPYGDVEVFLADSGAAMSGVSDGKYVYHRRDPLPSERAGGFPPDDPDVPPMVAAAMVRPGQQRSMNHNDLHHALDRRHAAVVRARAKQLGIKITGFEEYCDFCARSKAFRIVISKALAPHRLPMRPLYRTTIDLAGSFKGSTGGSQFMFMILDLFTNYGWVLFLRNKSAGAVAAAFKAWHVWIKPLIELHGPVEFLLSDNGNEWVSKTDQRSPELKMWGKRETLLVLPFLIPGNRRRPRDHKLEAKGERAFYLSPTIGHSSRTRRVLLMSGAFASDANCTFGYTRRPSTTDPRAWESTAPPDESNSTTGEGSLASGATVTGVPPVAPAGAPSSTPAVVGESASIRSLPDGGAGWAAAIDGDGS